MSFHGPLYSPEISSDDKFPFVEDGPKPIVFVRTIQVHYLHCHVFGLIGYTVSKVKMKRLREVYIEIICEVIRIRLIASMYKNPLINRIINLIPPNNLVISVIGQ